MHARLIFIVLAAAFAVTALPATLCAQQSPDPEALTCLANSLQDDANANSTLIALRAAGDKEIFPLLAACAQSGDKKRRLFAASALAEVAPQQAPPVLLALLQTDPVMTIRAEALVHLLELKALSAAQLVEATRIGDESIQCIAARSLVQLGQPEAARETLVRLAGSSDLATACMAKMTLLLIGRGDLLEPLRAVMTDPKTPDDVLALLLEQIAEEKIAPAVDLAAMIVKGNAGTLLKVRAFKALSAISASPAALAQAIADSTDLIYRVHLLHVLADRSDAAAELARLAKQDDVIGTLARFELGRLKDPGSAASAASAALQAGHPVVLDFVLDSVRKDMKNQPSAARAYVPALLQLIRSVSPDTAKMQAEHFRAANAAKLLCDIGTPDAVAGLQAILRGRYTAIVRATATGIYKSTNGQVACLLVRELLNSPFEELATDAALTLGRHGDPAAARSLADIVRHPRQNPSPLVALACWYTFKIQNQTTPAAKALAAQIK